jgi:FkbM family methyltransferase
MAGREVIAYLRAEHDWVAAHDPEQTYTRAISCSTAARTWEFSFRKALELGARKVVAIEPEPVNLECLQRNYKKEIAEGRVVVAACGVWSSAGTMRLFLSNHNSGMNSMVRHESGPAVEVPTRTIDSLVDELRLARVD